MANKKRKYYVQVAREVVEEYVDIEVEARSTNAAIKKAEKMVRDDPDTYFTDVEIEYHHQEAGPV